MGNPKQKWTAEEEEALRAGIAKHGVGRWKNIQRDPEFNRLLFTRSNIDLKDKWRNLSVANGAGPRDKSRIIKGKANPAETPSASLPITQNSGAVASSSQDGPADVIMVDAPKPAPEGNSAALVHELIFEALSTLMEPNSGSDCNTIASYIEERQEVPQNFKRVLSSRLRRLVSQGKLEKVQNCYRLKRDPHQNVNPAMTKPKDMRGGAVESMGYCTTVEDAAFLAIKKVADAENKASVASDAVKEAERVSAMVVEAEALLQFAIDCFDQSARGEILLMV